MTEENIAPLTEDKQRARARLIKKLEPGAKLLVVQGIKKGRRAIYQGPDQSNPWLLRATFDGRPSIVRFDFVVRE